MTSFVNYLDKSVMIRVRKDHNQSRKFFDTQDTDKREGLVLMTSSDGYKKNRFELPRNRIQAEKIKCYLFIMHIDTWEDTIHEFTTPFYHNNGLLYIKT